MVSSRSPQDKCPGSGQVPACVDSSQLENVCQSSFPFEFWSFGAKEEGPPEIFDKTRTRVRLHDSGFRVSGFRIQDSEFCHPLLIDVEYRHIVWRQGSGYRVEGVGVSLDAMRDQLIFLRHIPESQGCNLDWTVLHVPYWFSSGHAQSWPRPVHAAISYFIWKHS